MAKIQRFYKRHLIRKYLKLIQANTYWLITSFVLHLKDASNNNQSYRVIFYKTRDMSKLKKKRVKIYDTDIRSNQPVLSQMQELKHQLKEYKEAEWVYRMVATNLSMPKRNSARKKTNTLTWPDVLLDKYPDMNADVVRDTIDFDFNQNQICFNEYITDKYLVKKQIVRKVFKQRQYNIVTLVRLQRFFRNQQRKLFDMCYLEKQKYLAKLERDMFAGTLKDLSPEEQLHALAQNDQSVSLNATKQDLRQANYVLLSTRMLRKDDYVFQLVLYYNISLNTIIVKALHKSRKHVKEEVCNFRQQMLQRYGYKELKFFGDRLLQSTEIRQQILGSSILHKVVVPRIEQVMAKITQTIELNLAVMEGQDKQIAFKDPTIEIRRLYNKNTMRMNFIQHQSMVNVFGRRDKGSDADRRKLQELRELEKEAG